MTDLRLRGESTGLTTTTDVWDDVLELAEEFGWRPEQTRSLYRADVGLHITAGDAGNLARSLERLADHITKHEPDIDVERRARILGDLSRLMDLCRRGEFRIC